MRSLTRESVWTLLVILGVLLAPALMAADTDADAMSYLRRFDVRLGGSDGVLKANLITITPASGKIVVKTADAEQKTIVLALDSDFKVMEGKMRKSADELQRGDTVVLVVDVNSKAVKAIYRYF
jgi:hypothetical protein